MKLQFSVYVNLIRKNYGRTLVRATNGGDEGPPLIEFEVPSQERTNVYIGKGYTVTVESHDD